MVASERDVGDSTLLKCISMRYRVSNAMWDNIYERHLERKDSGVGQSSQYSKQTPKPKRASTTLSYAMKMQYLHDALTAEMEEGAPPFFKLNSYKLYLACVEVVEKVSYGMHQDETRCLCFVEDILSGVDRKKQATKLEEAAWTKEESDTVQRVKAAMKEVFGDGMVGDWMWDI